MNKPEINLPPPPIQPLPEECCGRGCENCVYVYYEAALKRWQEKVAVILAEHGIEFIPCPGDE